MPVEFKDYYAILEVPRTASDQDIKKVISEAGPQVPPRCGQGQKDR
jgi:curved DNA-binding protein CbpA